MICGGGPTGGGLFAAANPDAEPIGCCYGEVMGGIEGCTCWRPVFDVDQAQPRPVPREQWQTQPQRCGDCAYRPGSKELADPFTREELTLTLPAGDRPFWCHQGMRRPAAWEHPGRGVIDADPDDWQPAQERGVPYQADGSVALICAGWAAIRSKTARPR